MKQIEKTIFISYRRTDISWALLIYQNLTHQGYDVFFDYSGLASGDFEHAIFENIKARAHFLVLLTPATLDRCGEPSDLLRREIETALDSQRNIVPLMLDGFDFNAPATVGQLTGDLAALKRYNALNVPADFFDESMDRLRNRFLNVPLDAVLHSSSTIARQAAEKEQVAANIASVKIASTSSSVKLAESKLDSKRLPAVTLAKQVTSVRGIPPIEELEEAEAFFKKPLWWLLMTAVMTVSIGTAFLAQWIIEYGLGVFNLVSPDIELSWLVLGLGGFAWGIAYIIVGTANAEPDDLIECLAPLFGQYEDLFNPIDMGEFLRASLSALPINFLISWSAAIGLGVLAAAQFGANLSGVVYLVFGVIVFFSIVWFVLWEL